MKPAQLLLSPSNRNGKSMRHLVETSIVKTDSSPPPPPSFNDLTVRSKSCRRFGQRVDRVDVPPEVEIGKKGPVTIDADDSRGETSSRREWSFGSLEVETNRNLVATSAVNMSDTGPTPSGSNLYEIFSTAPKIASFSRVKEEREPSSLRGSPQVASPRSHHFRSCKRRHR